MESAKPGCFDCVDGHCTMNCGPAVQQARVIFKTAVGYVAQDPAGDRGFIYRVMSHNNICLFESLSAPKAIEYAEWFADSKSARNARQAVLPRANAQTAA